jgi:hypothetical protein
MVEEKGDKCHFVRMMLARSRSTRGPASAIQTQTQFAAPRTSSKRRKVKAAPWPARSAAFGGGNASKLRQKDSPTPSEPKQQQTGSDQPAGNYGGSQRVNIVPKSRKHALDCSRRVRFWLRIRPRINAGSPLNPDRKDALATVGSRATLACLSDAGDPCRCYSTSTRMSDSANLNRSSVEAGSSHPDSSTTLSDWNFESIGTISPVKRLGPPIANVVND